MLSARELAPEQQPARRHVGQPADHVHPRHRRGDGAGQRRRPRAASRSSSSATCRRSRSAGAPTDHRAADLLRGAPERLDHHRRPPERVRLPGRRDQPTAAPSPARPPAGPARPASSSTRPCRGCSSRSASGTSTCSSATRSPADSQLLFHRSIADRLPRIAPFLRFDKDPYLVVTSDGRLVYIQDAYTMSDRFPNAQWFDPADLPSDSGLARPAVQLHPQQRQDRRWTPTPAR